MMCKPYMNEHGKQQDHIIHIPYNSSSEILHRRFYMLFGII